MLPACSGRDMTRPGHDKRGTVRGDHGPLAECHNVELKLRCSEALSLTPVYFV